MRCTQQTIRPSAGKAMSPPGHLPVPHHPARRAATQPMPHPRRACGEVALGRTLQPIHRALRRPPIAWLKAASQKAVAGQLGLSWDEIHGIMYRAVKRGLARRQAEPIRHLGVDEKAFRKGHKYMTVVNDLVRGRVLYVAEDRKQESLDGFWGTLTEGPGKGSE